MVEIKGNNAGGTLQLNCENNSHGVKLQSPDHSAAQSYTLKLPDNQVAANKILKVKSITGSGATAVGQLEFADQSGGSVGNNADDITAGDAAVTIATTTGDITIDAQGSDTDIYFKGTDNTTDITALWLDMSGGGIARFNSSIRTPDYAWFHSNDDINLMFGVNFEIQVEHVLNTGLRLKNTTSPYAPYLQFVDANESIGSDGTNLILTSGGTAFKMPTADGSNTHVLQTDGNGNLSFVAQSGGGGGVTVQDEGSALSTTATTLDFVGAGVVASGTGATKTITISGGGSGITVQDEGSALSTVGTTLNFVGAGVTASGTGATKTITISGGGGGGGITTGKAIAMAMVFG